MDDKEVFSRNPHILTKKNITHNMCLTWKIEMIRRQPTYFLLYFFPKQGDNLLQLIVSLYSIFVAQAQ